MAKHNFSKIFKMDPMVLKQIAIKGDPNSPYAKTLKLRVGEAFVVYNASLDDVCLPYSRAKKLGMKFVTKSNFRLGERKGLLVTRVS